MTDEEFLARFESGAIPQAEWTHRAHVKMAYLYLSRHSFSEALALIRSGIQRLNAALGAPTSPAGGYHETTTVAFARLIAAAIEARGTRAFGTSDEFCEAHPRLMTSRALWEYYSPERRHDPRGKSEYLEPDLAPLPPCDPEIPA